MKFHHIVASALLGASLMAGCSGGGTPAAQGSATPTQAVTEPAGFVVKVNGAEVPFAIQQARVDVRPDVTEAQFSIANYDFDMKHMEANSLDRPKEDGKVRIAFSLKGEKGEGESFKNPVQPGEYAGEKLIWMDLYQGKDGQDGVVNLSNPTGGVTIKTVTDTELTGSVDVKGDGGLEIKGEFSAARVPTE
jgi:hypothetical protein